MKTVKVLIGDDAMKAIRNFLFARKLAQTDGLSDSFMAKVALAEDGETVEIKTERDRAADED